MGSSLNQRTAEFSLCNTLVLLLDLAFKQHTPHSIQAEQFECSHKVWATGDPGRPIYVSRQGSSDLDRDAPGCSL